MSDDLLPVAKAIEELEPAVQAFAEASGTLDPIREVAAWATDLIRYRRAPHQAKLLIRAAEKIKASGLPASAVEDKLLRAVLEDGPMEDDETMQERWSSLLANAVVRPAATVATFPRILADLTAPDVDVLEKLASLTFAGLEHRQGSNLFDAAHQLRLNHGIPIADLLSVSSDGDMEFALDNLDRLGLIRFDAPIYGEDPNTPWASSAFLTYLGWRFVQACRPPRPAE